MICNRCYQRTLGTSGQDPLKCQYCGSTSLSNAGMGDYGSTSQSTESATGIYIVLGVLVLLILCAIIYFLPQIAKSSIMAWVTWIIGSLLFTIVVTLIFLKLGSDEEMDEIIVNILQGTFMLTMFKVIVVVGRLIIEYFI